MEKTRRAPLHLPHCGLEMRGGYCEGRLGEDVGVEMAVEDPDPGVTQGLNPGSTSYQLGPVRQSFHLL